MANWPPKFEQALASQQTETAYRLAHDLNGVATTIGAAMLARRAAALEKSLWKTAPAPARVRRFSSRRWLSWPP